MSLISGNGAFLKLTAPIAGTAFSVPNEPFEANDPADGVPRIVGDGKLPSDVTPVTELKPGDGRESSSDAPFFFFLSDLPSN